MPLGRPWFAAALAPLMVAGCELLVASDDYAPFPASIDAAVDAPLEATAVAVDASVDVLDAQSPNLGISCGFGYCVPGTETCCVGRCSLSMSCIGRDDAGAFVCPVQIGENCGWHQLHCDDTADCPSDQVCCGVGEQASCLRLLDCQSQAAPHAVLCDPAATAPCPNGASCARRDAGRPACVGL